MTALAWIALAVLFLLGVVGFVWALCVAAEAGDEDLGQAMRDEARERARTLHE